MKKYSIIGFVCGLQLSAIPAISSAQPLDEVNLEFQSQGVVATIHLTEQVQYLRHFPESHGKTLEIYFERAPGAAGTVNWVDNEMRKSPPSALIPNFTVTTRDQKTQPKLVIEFSREAEFGVAAGKDGRSLLLTIRPEKRAVSNEPLPFLPTVKPLLKPAAGATLTPEQAAAADINAQAYVLMMKGRDALAAKNNEAATEALNKLLLLPPNDYTQDGQEWIGVARERAGQGDKAKVEYDLYLRIYPEGAGAGRVAQRMAGLSPGVSKPMTEVQDKKQRVSSATAFGSISSRYYFGRSKIDTTNTFNSTTQTDSQAFKDQSMLITSVDASERFRSEDRDARLVFRDVNVKNFMTNQPGQNRVNAAYGEVKGRTHEYLVRLGRQSSMGAGVLGRFDGIFASYGNAQDLRGSAVAGALMDYSKGAKPRFYGMSLEKGAFTLYGINQTLEGLQDRRAVGSEVRYFDEKRSAFGLLDYDTYFKAVNAAQLSGTAGLAGSNASVNVIIDHRKAPSLSIRNALNGATVSSVAALQQSLQQTGSGSSLRDLALSRTATSNMGQIGITVPWREKWQVGGDIRLTNTTGLPSSGQSQVLDVNGNPLFDANGNPVLMSSCTGAITDQGCLAAQPGRGTEKSLTGQIIGSGLYKEGDVWSGSLTFSTSSMVSGRYFYLYNHTQFRNGWAMDTSLQISGYKDQWGGSTTRIWPMLRGAYRIRDQFYFDADIGYERINYSGHQNDNFISSRTTRLSCSVGLRWDF
jgi:hypothetical protein